MSCHFPMKQHDFSRVDPMSRYENEGAENFRCRALWDRKEVTPVIERILLFSCKDLRSRRARNCLVCSVHPCCMCLELFLSPMCGTVLQPVVRAPAPDRKGLFTTVLQRTGAQPSRLLVLQSQLECHAEAF